MRMPNGFQMTSERGTFTILCVWMMRRDQRHPELVTAYPESQ